MLYTYAKCAYITGMDSTLLPSAPRQIRGLEIEMQVAHINENGLQQIAAALGEYHKLGRDHFTQEMLRAWAADAEDHLSIRRQRQMCIRDRLHPGNAARLGC